MPIVPIFALSSCPEAVSAEPKSLWSASRFRTPDNRDIFHETSNALRHRSWEKQETSAFGCFLDLPCRAARHGYGGAWSKRQPSPHVFIITVWYGCRPRRRHPKPPVMRERNARWADSGQLAGWAAAGRMAWVIPTDRRENPKARAVGPPPRTPALVPNKMGPLLVPGCTQQCGSLRCAERWTVQCNLAADHTVILS